MVVGGGSDCESQISDILHSIYSVGKIIILNQQTRIMIVRVQIDPCVLHRDGFWEITVPNLPTTTSVIETRGRTNDCNDDFNEFVWKHAKKDILSRLSFSIVSEAVATTATTTSTTTAAGAAAVSAAAPVTVQDMVCPAIQRCKEKQPGGGELEKSICWNEQDQCHLSKDRRLLQTSAATPLQTPLVVGNSMITASAITRIDEKQSLIQKKDGVGRRTSNCSKEVSGQYARD